MLPRIDEETVEAAERGQQKRRRKKGEPEAGLARDRRDKGRRGEADADGDLLGKTMSAPGRVDDHEVAEDQPAEDEIEPDRLLGNARQKKGQKDRRDPNPGHEHRAVPLMEVVAGFEPIGAYGMRVQQTISGIERPDSGCHRDQGGCVKWNVIDVGDEPGPEGGDGRGVKREQMPQDQR